MSTLPLPHLEQTSRARHSVLDVGLLAQSGMAQPGGKPLVAAMGELAVEQEAEPVSELRSSARGIGSSSWCSH